MVFELFKNMYLWRSRRDNGTPPTPLLLRPLQNVLAWVFAVNSDMDGERIRLLECEKEQGNQRFYASQHQQETERHIYAKHQNDLREYMFRLAQSCMSVYQDIDIRTSALGRENENLVMERNELQARLTEIQESYQAMVEGMAGMSEEVETLEDKIESLEKKIEVLKFALEQAGGRIQGLQNEVKDKDMKLREAESQRNNLIVVFASLQKENSGLKALIDATPVSFQDGIVEQTSL